MATRGLKIIGKGHIIDAQESNPIACPLRQDNTGRDQPCTSWCAWFSLAEDGLAKCQETIIGTVAPT